MLGRKYCDTIDVSSHVGMVVMRGNTSSVIPRTRPAFSFVSSTFLKKLVFFVLQVKIREAKGLPKNLSNFVFCQYQFWGHDEPISVPPDINPEVPNGESKTTKTVKFCHERVGTYRIWHKLSLSEYRI